jgi:hypothetical protein
LTWRRFWVPRANGSAAVYDTNSSEPPCDVIRRVWVPVFVLASAACGAPKDVAPLPIDLVRELPHALIQAAPAAPGARQDFAPAEDGPVPALFMTAPARVTWTLQFPETAEVVARVALVDGGAAGQGVTVRLGISDNRAYHELLREHLPAGAPGSPPSWRTIRGDLSEFSGWKWSLFYHPSRMTWRLIANADATPGGTAAWTGLMVRRAGSSEK